MAGIIIHPEKISDRALLKGLCPFGAIETLADGTVQINSACRVCRVCVKNGESGAFEYREDVISAANKSEWQGITVLAEMISNEQVHPVVFELLGKAREMADTVQFSVSLVLFGSGLKPDEASFYAAGADTLYCYDDARLANFDAELFAAVAAEYVHQYKPSAILIGGTPLGRSLAPRLAAKLHTGLTADCTELDIQPSTDLDQIRPAFGGNIMAHIRTPYHRPQLATVRYKIFSPLIPDTRRTGMRIDCEMPASLAARSQHLETIDKEKVKNIEDADSLVVVGRGFKKKEDLILAYALAELLGAEIACTRPLIEAGWMDPRRQIGLSGRTVKPKLLIACGVSGSVQFAAGMKGSEVILSINDDPDAAINLLANTVVIGDLYKIIPLLLEKLETRGAK